MDRLVTLTCGLSIKEFCAGGHWAIQGSNSSAPLRKTRVVTLLKCRGIVIPRGAIGNRYNPELAMTTPPGGFYFRFPRTLVTENKSGSAIVRISATWKDKSGSETIHLGTRVINHSASTGSLEALRARGLREATHRPTRP